jgi:hypothetical protein
MQRFLAVRSLTGFLVAVLLASCGGGGGGGVGPGIPEISAGSPPPGENGVAYPGYTFTVASGGSPPFSWAVTSGALPTDLTLASNGSLSGTPTATDSFTFTVTVTDSAATPATNSKPFTIKVGEPPPTIISAQPPTAIEGVVYPPFTFTAGGGLAPLVWSETGPLPDLAFSLDGVLSGTPSGAGKFPISLDVKDALNRSAPSAPVTVRVALARPPASFTATGSMSGARSGHAATLLLDGQVLVAGGLDASAELYDPASGTFTVTGSMTVARARHTATLLNNAALPNYGKVLIAGGDQYHSGATSAELYDPATGTFTATGNMTGAVLRDTFTATLLNTGKVLVAGGNTGTAELYDPATETFSATGSMTATRTGHLAALLLDGRVLMIGGGLTTAETYDPAAGVFTATVGSCAYALPKTATRLTDGRVLVTGCAATAQVFDPTSGLFMSGGDIIKATAAPTASLLKDGTVLLAGGYVSAYIRICSTCEFSHRWVYYSQAFAERFAPECEGFTATGSLVTPRDGHTATTLSDGSVLVVGGVKRVKLLSTVLSSAELYR